MQKNLFKEEYITEEEEATNQKKISSGIFSLFLAGLIYENDPFPYKIPSLLLFMFLFRLYNQVNRAMGYTSHRDVEVKSPQKINYREHLAKKEARAINQNRIHTGGLSLFLWAFAHYDPIPLNILSLALGEWLYESYDVADRLAKRPLLFYDAEVKFREAAQNDNVGVIKDYLWLFGREYVNAQGPSKRNALHFAIHGGAINAVELLMKVDESINKTRPKHMLQYMINHTDEMGNTPVHSAIKAIIADEKSKEKNNEKRYSVLFALLRKKVEKATDPGVNMNVNPLIQNKQGETILDLISNVKDKTTLNFQQAEKLIQNLTEIYKRAVQVNVERQGQTSISAPRF